jgi:hypothetical protein
LPSGGEQAAESSDLVFALRGFQVVRPHAAIIYSTRYGALQMKLAPRMHTDKHG